MNVTGNCHCGEVEFTAIVDENSVLICHCNDCQTLSGSAFRTVVKSQLNGFTFTKGKAKEYIKLAASGNKRAQGFCQHCGSSLYACNQALEDRIYSVRVGVLKQRGQLMPKSQNWCNAAMPWLTQLNLIPRFLTTPDKG